MNHVLIDLRCGLGLLFGLLLLLTAGCGNRADEQPSDAGTAQDAPGVEGDQRASGDASIENASAPPPSPASDDVMPEVVARVGDHVITRDDYAHELLELQERIYMQRHGRRPIPNMSELPALTDEHRALMLNSMIEARIFGSLADAADIEVSEEEVDAQLQELKERLLTETEYERFLQRAAATDETLRKNIRQRLLLDKFGERLIQGVDISEGQIEQAYGHLKSRGSLQQARSADIAHIFVAITPEVDEHAAKAKIDAIYARILAGDDFEEVAKEVSEDPVSAPGGGVYEKVVRGQLGQSIDDRLFMVPLNEVTEPFRSLKGWHIMKVLERHESSDLTFEEARPAIEKTLREVHKREAMARAVADARPDMDIDIFIDLDLQQRREREIIPIPPEAVVNPDALPEALRPGE
jgi:peptidyl-prolyl cis-trans isomerase SurA